MASHIENQRYLTGIIFPAQKETVISALQRNNAPTDLIGIVQNDKMQRFVSPASVSQVWWNAA